MPARQAPAVSDPLAFPTPGKLRAWFARHATRRDELWIRFYKLATGKPSVTYGEALDEALCVGWIDGLKRSLDAESYVQRFTPRRPGSYWSAINVAKAEALVAAGRMTPAGLAAFEQRERSAEARYSYENRPAELPPAAAAALRADRAAWTFWSAQPPGYRKAATWHVISAKRAETQARRLAALIACSARGERIPQLVSSAKAPAKGKAKAGAKATPAPHGTRGGTK